MRSKRARSGRSASVHQRWARVGLKGVFFVAVGALLAYVARPAPVQATSCAVPEEVYDLTLRSVEALDGGNAEAQRAFWAEEGMFIERAACCGKMALAPPWWETTVECTDDPCN